MRGDAARKERAEVLLPRESEVPLNDPGGPEHESELAAAEAVRQRRLGGVVVAVELRFEELRRRLFRGVRNGHGEPQSGFLP